jgi:hypothetical protein
VTEEIRPAMNPAHCLFHARRLDGAAGVTVGVRENFQTSGCAGTPDGWSWKNDSHGDVW